MFASSFSNSLQMLGFDGLLATGDLAIASGARRTRIANNTKALTEDRLFVMYDHFHNAIEADASQFVAGPDQQDYSVDRFTFGFEKSFFNRMLSVDIRMPVSSDYLFSTPNFGVSGGNAGNLAVSLKCLLTQGPSGSAVMGVTADLPTGADAYGQVNGIDYQVENDATHLSPFLGLLHTPDPLVFQQLFMQLDLPTSGDNIRFFPPNDFVSSKIEGQEMIYIDYACGIWLIGDGVSSGPREAVGLRRLASIFEVNYATTLEDTKAEVFVSGPTMLAFTNLADRQDLLNMTLGLHAELGNGTQVRVAGVAPLREDDDRLFDFALQLQVNVGF